MNVRCSKLAGGVWLLLGLGGFAAISAETTNKSIEAAQPGVSAVLTNLSRSAPRKDGLKQLEEEFSKALQSFSPKGSLDGIMAPEYTPPPPRVVIPNRRAKEDSERRKDWMFGNPDDPGNIGPDPLKPSNSRSGKERTAFDELYEKLGGPRSANRPNSSKGDSLTHSDRLPGSIDDSDLDDNANLPSGIRESAKNLRQKLLGSDTGEKLFNPSPTRSTLSDLFAPEEKTLSKHDIQAHKDYIERFKQILDTSSVNAGGSQSPFNSLAVPRTPVQPYGGFDAFRPSASRDAVASKPGNVNSILNQATSPDFNASILNQWNPLYAPPKPEPPKPVPFSTPLMEVPRRRF